MRSLWPILPSCVIKADAYGHGAVRMAEEYEALGADWLALSNIEEALQVRRAGIKLPLLVLGYTPAEAADVLAENDIAQCEDSRQGRYRHEPPRVLFSGH